MNPPPPMPEEKGSATPSTAAAATAASTALPPCRRTRMPSAVARRLTEATAPPLPTATGCLTRSLVVAETGATMTPTKKPMASDAEISRAIRRLAMVPLPEIQSDHVRRRPDRVPPCLYHTLLVGTTAATHPNALTPRET